MYLGAKENGAASYMLHNHFLSSSLDLLFTWEETFLDSKLDHVHQRLIPAHSPKQILVITLIKKGENKFLIYNEIYR
jgi:hypothetical protein